MSNNFISRLAAYLLLLTFGGLLLPIPKVYLATILLVSLLLYLVNTAITHPSTVLIFLVFIIIPLVAFQVPTFIPATLPPLHQLAIATALWGTLISLLVSILSLSTSYIRLRLGQTVPSRSDHAPK